MRGESRLRVRRRRGVEAWENCEQDGTRKGWIYICMYVYMYNIHIDIDI